MNLRNQILILGVFLVCGGTAAAQPKALRMPQLKPTIAEVAVAASDHNGNIALQSTPSAVTAVIPVGGRRYFSPTPGGNVAVEYEGARTTFGNIASTKMGAFLSQVDESIEITKADTGATLNSALGSGSVNRGDYDVTYYYYRYRMIPCPGGPSAGGVAIGFGIRVTASFTSTKGNVSVSGFMPLAVAANANKISGRIRIESSGISSGTGSIASYLSGVSDLNPESIRKAVESFGVVKAVYETPSVTLTPYYLFVESPDIAKCLASFAPAM